MKRELILFYYLEKKFSLKQEEIKILKKKYSNIIIYQYPNKFNLKNFDFKNKKLNNIKRIYKRLGIYLDINKIYEINSFIKKIVSNKNRKKFIVSPYFINNSISEDEFIFYELSKLYKLQFVKPELSFIKNRYLLSKNLFKQQYEIKKKTTFSKHDYKIFKVNYISSMQTFSEQAPIKIKFKYFSSILIKILNFILNLKLNKKPKKFVLVIFNNNQIMTKLSRIINLKYFINMFLKKFNYELVFLLHPNTNPANFFLKVIKNKNFFFLNKKITFFHKPKNLVDIIQDSNFIIHLTSSLSAQTLVLDKKILCLGKENIYIKNLKNIVSNIRKNNFNYLKKKMNNKDLLVKNKFLTNYLSNTVNSQGEFRLLIKKKNYLSNSRPKQINKYDKKIIQNLLNAI